MGDVVQRRPTKLCTVFGHILSCYTIYTLPPDGISPSAKFTLRPSLVFCYIGSVTARHSSSGVSQTLLRGTRNGITERSQRAPPTFGWAVITLGIVPHSSFVFSLTAPPLCVSRMKVWLHTASCASSRLVKVLWPNHNWSV